MTNGKHHDKTTTQQTKPPTDAARTMAKSGTTNSAARPAPTARPSEARR